MVRQESSSQINFLHWVSIQSPYPCRDFTNQDYFQSYVKAGRILYAIGDDEERVIKHCTKENYRLIIIYRKDLNPLVLFDPFEILNNADSNGLAEYYLKVNKRIFGTELIRTQKSVSAPSNLLFEVLYSLPEDKIILYLPTVLILVRLAGLDRFIQHYQFFDDTTNHHITFIEQFKHDSIVHNYICLASGKLLSSPGLFASRKQYDSFTRSDSIKRMNKVCRFLMEHFILWNKKNCTTDINYDDLQENITDFCKNSIEGKSFNGRKHPAEPSDGYYPELHHESNYNLIEEFEKGIFNYGLTREKKKNNQKEEEIVHFGYTFSKYGSQQWNFKIENPLKLLRDKLLLRRQKNLLLTKDYKQEYFDFIKANLQLNNLVIKSLKLEPEYLSPPKDPGNENT